MADGLERIALGGGCFWCTEAVMKMVPGVVKVTPGYAGGTTENPTYEGVCGGATGHAEVVLVEYDPEEVSPGKVLEVFFSSHDPTTPNRQGNDIGTQYRSIILYTTEEQQEEARRVIERLSAGLDRPVVTELAPLGAFYPAEDYHHDYYRRNPARPYCRLVVAPKVRKAEKQIGSA